MDSKDGGKNGQMSLFFVLIFIAKGPLWFVVVSFSLWFIVVGCVRCGNSLVIPMMESGIGFAVPNS